jgi:hypothetical protein
MSQCLFIHTTAVVAYGHPNILSGHKAGMRTAVLFVQNVVSRLDGHFPNTRNSVPGIDAEIGHDLVDLRRIDHG